MVPLARAEMPTEVYEGIIDALGPDCATLAQCALTCRAWLPRSRYNLYRRTTLRSQAQLSSFSQTLHNSPVGSEPCPADIVEELILWPMGITQRMFVNSACITLAGDLPRLKELSITLDHDLSHFRRAMRLDFSLPIHIASFPNLKRLRLHNTVLNSFMTLGRAIVALPNLSSLDLSSVVWRTSGDMSSNLLILEVGCCKLEDITVRRFQMLIASRLRAYIHGRVSD